MQTHQEAPVQSSEPIVPPEIPNRRWLAPVMLAGLAVLLGGLIVLGVLPRVRHLQGLEKAAATNGPVYSVARASGGEATTELVLPSSVEALQEAPLYPRVSGYVKRIVADIGTRVNAGDLLAEIETPELDHQVAQARAAVDQATANLNLAQISYVRWQEMQKNRVVAAQEVDERKGALDARKADLNAATANLQRLEQTQRFQKITAPFAGTITKRFVEVGQLVTGDLNDTTRILFRLEQTTALRAFINVPQSSFRLVKAGQTVALTFREFPGRTFSGTVVRTAGALDGATRTLRTEVQVPNEAGELLPGLYAEVRFQVQRERPPITVPARALIIQTAGPQIATVDALNKVTLRPVTIGRDLGKTLELAAGLEANASFILNPTDTLRDGMIVEVERSEAPKIASK